ncbi:MAG: NADH-quinone oxidoreductase subunit NuoE [Clostridiales bacterium]|nr:NADH-quinone oxidoreductase subunit NuoE [Clostridiales bacterium]
MSQQNCCCCGGNCVDERLEKIKKVIEEYKTVKGGLIPVLHQIQNTYGYLPEDVLKLVSQELNIPMAEIFGVASFYSYFSLEPKGEHKIRVCLGTACYVKGAQALIDKISKELNVEVGKTTEDGKFTLEATRCLGACGLAPVMVIGEKVYGRITPDDIPGILKEYK